MKKITATILILIILGGIWYFLSSNGKPLEVSNFEECVETGNLIMESYPRQCQHNGQSFTEDIGNELDKADLIRLDSPRPNQEITSPVKITGEARGYWFFEASFPVFLTDWDGKIIAQGIATAQSDPTDVNGASWMSEDFVPFEVSLEFELEKDIYSKRGTLILQKDNPSGLPEHDDALEIPVLFVSEGGPTACTAEAKICPDGSAVGRTGPNCEFEKCPSTGETLCQPEQRNVDACIEIYQPVCGQVQVECITAPCNPVPETFSNSCFACMNSRVISYTNGECQP